MRPETRELGPRQVGVIGSLSAGFELTTGNLWLVILPFLVDLFLWIGPRLHITALLHDNLAWLQSDPGFAPLVEDLLDSAQEINLFTTVSLPLVGIPTLMSGPTPIDTPLEPISFELGDSLQWFLIFAGLLTLGLLLSSLYYGMLGLAINKTAVKVGPRLSAIVLSTITILGRLMGLILIFLILAAAVLLPLLPVAVLLGLFSQALFFLVLFFGILLALVYLSMSLPGIVLGGLSAPRAVYHSVRFVHRNLTGTLILLATIQLVGYGTSLLWREADDGSWITLASIAGHGFISTSLVAAFLLFYHGRAIQHQQRQT